MRASRAAQAGSIFIERVRERHVTLYATRRALLEAGRDVLLRSRPTST